MSNPNLLDIAIRKKIIDDIKSPDNVARKMAEQRKADIYRKRQAQYVLERLKDEFDSASVANMRKVLSINPCKRIVDEQASLYVSEPDRQFTEASDKEKDQIKYLYAKGKVDPTMRSANRKYKLHGQSCLYAVPRDGYIYTRALAPKDYDVIPDCDNPEVAFAYALNVLDVTAHRSAPQEATGLPSDGTYHPSGTLNLSVADNNDRKVMSERYVFWTKELHFTCDGYGSIIDAPYETADGALDTSNPIGMLPFVDIAHEKDFSFFVSIGSDVAEFVIDLLTQLSDLANTCRMQNYSQAIIYSSEEPKNVNVGPNKIIWLKIDPKNPGATPKFAFESPSPDIMGTLEVINVQLKMFLSSVGLNPGTVSGKNEMEKFTSGLDHLLANLDKFKASKEDMDLFRAAEVDLFKIMVAWQNALFDVTDENGLDDEAKAIKVDPTLKLSTVFIEPHAVQTDSEVKDYCIGAVEAGLMSKKTAVKKMYKVDDDRADEIIAEIALDPQAEGESVPPVDPDKPIDPNADPNAPPPTAGDAPEIADDVRKETLNGAQIQSVVDLVQSVAANQMPRDAAMNIIMIAFNVDSVIAERMMGSAGKGFKITPAEAPAPGAPTPAMKKEKALTPLKGKPKPKR